MDEVMKFAGAVLIVLTVLFGLHVLPAGRELEASGVVLGLALAYQHAREATRRLRERLIAGLVALWRWLRNPARKD